MKQIQVGMVVVLMLLCCSLFGQAQQTVATSTNAVVPTLVSFSGVLTGSNGKPLTSITGVTFSLYAEQEGGAPLWLETQNVQPDKNGNYSVMLGSTTSQGLPASLFASGQARWLEVQAQGQEPQPRVMLLSVPYALKAGDAQTLGGKPASAFVTASGSNSSNPNGVVNNALSGGGTTDYVPLWLSKSKLGSSKIFQSTAGDLGIGTISPAANLDVNGTSDIRNTLTLFPNGSAPALSVNGTAFEVSNTGSVTFVSGQTFPGTGTVTSVGSGAGLTGGPITTSGTLSVATGGVTNAMLANSSLTVNAGTALTGGGAVSLGGSTTLNLDTTKVPLLGAANTFTENQTVSGTMTATTFTGSGSGLTNVTAANSNELGGLAPSAFAQLAASNAFTGNNVFTASSTDAIEAFSNVPGAIALVAAESATSGGSYGVQGNTYDASGAGVLGANESTSGGTGVLGASPNGGFGVNGLSGTSLVGCGTCVNSSYGVYGQSNSGYGVVGTATSSGVDGVHGESSSESSGVAGLNFNTTSGFGVFGVGYGTSGTGVFGAGNGYGVYGNGGPTGVYGYGDNTGVYGSGPTGVYGYGDNTGVYGYGDNTGVYGYGGNYGVIGTIPSGSDGWAGWFNGNVEVDGNLSKGGGSFKIDHPLDPANKYLYHSFVESPDMMNIYNGVATLDANGEAVIPMPEWFGVLNRDFRYQLTPIGAPGPNLYIAEEFVHGHFKIAGGKPGSKVSWQITGIRQDAWANAHRIPVEEEKEARLKGFYIHPELYGAPPEKQIEWARHPEMMKKLQEPRQQMKEKQARQPITPPTVELHLPMIPSAAVHHDIKK